MLTKIVFFKIYDNGQLYVKLYGSSFSKSVHLIHIEKTVIRYSKKKWKYFNNYSYKTISKYEIL